MKAFVEIGQPNRSYNDKNPSDYSNQSRGSNIGIRKIGVFNNSNLIFGAEYARLVQGVYYNIIPTPKIITKPPRKTCLGGSSPNKKIDVINPVTGSISNTGITLLTGYLFKT